MKAPPFGSVCNDYVCYANQYAVFGWSNGFGLPCILVGQPIVFTAIWLRDMVIMELSIAP